MLLFTVQQAVCTAAGVGGAFLANFLARRPLYASVYKHFLGGGAGFLIGTWLDETKEHYDQLNRKIVADYVSQHSDDFLEERKQFKDILRPWTPMR